MIVLYHDDPDGQCAANEVFFYYKDVLTESRIRLDPLSFYFPSYILAMTKLSAKNKTCYDDALFFPVNYNSDIPWEVIERNGADLIYILDFSLQRPGEWERLLGINSNVIWIDHHKSAIEDAPLEVQKLPGLRDIKFSGCELTWAYFNGQDPSSDQMPKVVRLVGDYDTWRFSHPDTRKFMAGFKTLCYVGKIGELSPICGGASLLSLRTHEDEVEELVRLGEIIDVKQGADNESTLSNWGYIVEFEGFRGVAVNRSCSSLMFESMNDSDYQLMLPHQWDGKQWTVSLYVFPRYKDEIDVSQIAKRFGGGGHRGAAGFQINELPWKVIKRIGDE